MSKVKLAIEDLTGKLDDLNARVDQAWVTRPRPVDREAA
jgi:hypothetical protein